MKRFGKKLFCGALAAGLLFTMVSCGDTSANSSSGAGASAGGSAPAENVKLTWWVGGTITPAEQKLPQDEWYITGLIERFEKAHPGVEIEITLQSDGMQTLQDFKAAAVAKNGPDIVELFAGPNMLSVKDGLLPLNDYITDEERSVIVGWNTCSDDLDASKTAYAYPYLSQSTVLPAYNRQILADAGYDFDANPPKTIEEFEAIMAALKAKGVQPFHTDESFPTLPYYILAYGWIQKTGTDGIYQHTAAKVPYGEDANFLEMLDRFQSWYKKGYINTDAATSADALNPFLQGKCAFYPVGNWDFPALAEGLGDNVSLIPTPSFTPDGAPGMVGGIGVGLAIANYSEHADLAVELVKQIVSRDELIEFYKLAPGVPLRTDISIKDLGMQDDPFLSRVVSWSDRIVYWADNCMSADSASAFAQFSSQVMVGNMTPKELAQKMDEAQQ